MIYVPIFLRYARTTNPDDVPKQGNKLLKDIIFEEQRSVIQRPWVAERI